MGSLGTGGGRGSERCLPWSWNGRRRLRVGSLAADGGRGLREGSVVTEAVTGRPPDGWGSGLPAPHRNMVCTLTMVLASAM